MTRKLKHQVLFVDGYNMIGAWPELNRLKKLDKLGDARDQLLFILSNYAKYKGIEIIVVFDAQLVPGIQQTYDKYGLTVIFTKEEETADTYIEREVPNKMNALSTVRVATSDLAEQWVVFSQGALRVSARELFNSIKEMEKEIKTDTQDYKYQNLRRNSPWNQEQVQTLKELFDELMYH
ncbi:MULTISPECIES: NYN domain-containing protein [Enterococcaceae]|uniref:DNA-binding protein n=1 Tax=Vagococcus luciliae TaxID=2920380 RepID=A0ABY5NYQ9_9ENTE|nr:MULTISPECIES: NYN domain-containing protein [Enterococcaceae]MCI0130939.1 NYN domain-containing protein [Vagococcus sp. CY53-2]RGI30315.1 NYN domain-containing protein [Melissococcus sp. OM08-11BH]UNM89324.1 NYN domain-containing protein [Vagococcus sp. CY52-2]UUV98606.1 hypothetical protein G314FT_07590 [Vagococcus luciliae]